jgi:DNA-binding transcriptional MerR regulator
MLKDRFSTRDVLDLTGTTARQLQWWDERRIVVPAREGRRRVYSAADLVDILVIEQLRERHISLQQVRRVLRFLRTELHARLSELVMGEREHHLLLDGKRIYLRTDSDQVVDLLRNTRQPVFLICLSDAVRRLRIDLANLPIEEVERKPVEAAARARTRRRHTRQASA